MKTIRMLIVMACMAGLAAFAIAQSAPTTQSAPSDQSAASATPPRVTPADAKNHLDETVIVCGKVVDIKKIPKYGLAGHGKPVSFDLDQPEPNPVFYFVTFGAQPGGPEEAIAAYKDKRVCVTGKVSGAPHGAPFIITPDRTQIQVQEEKK
jgi:hypothetical protein